MAKRIPLIIDADVKEVEATTPLSRLVPVGANSIVTGGGKIIPSSDFASYRAADVPEGFDTQTATINKAGARAGLLLQETALLNWWLSGFEPCPAGPRSAFLNDTHDFVGVANFPLPDGYRPDFLHLAIYVSRYPAVPPIGLYLANKDGNQQLIQQIRKRINVFNTQAFHGAENPLPGYEWVCLLSENWHVDYDDVRKGQNLQKYLSYFYALLAEPS